MPQTIAIQRGTTTVSTAGSTAVTLWTQSGGIATRVIVNQLCMSFGSIALNSPGLRAVLYLQSSGGQASVVGVLSNNNGGGFSCQWPVGANNANGFGGTGGGTSLSIGSASPCIVQFGVAGDMLAANASSVLTSYSSSVTNQGNIPSNFYIGPGDQLRMKINGNYISGKSQVSVTATISYSFTTITES